jgi:protein ImuA
MPSVPLADATLPLFADAPQPAAPALVRAGRPRPPLLRRAAGPGVGAAWAGAGAGAADAAAGLGPSPAAAMPWPGSLAALWAADSPASLNPSPATAPAPAEPPFAQGDKPAPSVKPPSATGFEPPPQPSAPRATGPDPAALHPLVWRAHQLGRQAIAAEPSGWATLDAQLPGGGWPHRALSELLLPHPGVGELRLLAHALAAVQRAGRLVMLFDPPAQLCAWAVAALGIEPEQLLVLHTRLEPGLWATGGAHAAAPGRSAGVAPREAAGGGGDSLWALEQALKSGHVGAVLAWLPPRLRIERLRRLQLAAAAHQGPAFVLRESAAAAHPTPAPLRLQLAPAGGDQLTLQLLKRRGPPLEQPLQLRLPAVLGLAAARRAQAARVGPVVSSGAGGGRAAVGPVVAGRPVLATAPGAQAPAEGCAPAPAASGADALVAGLSSGRAPWRAATFIQLGS